MTRCFAVGCFVLVTGVAVADPSVSGIPSVTPRPSGEVDVSYTLAAGEDAVVTVSFETNALLNASGTWIRLPDAAVTRLSGAVNRRVKPGARTLTWRPDPTVSAGLATAVPVRAVVTPWPVSQPPPYMVVDLGVKTNVHYYVSTNALPGGVADETYRRYKLLLRRIPAKDVVWRMGKVGASGWQAAHYVTFKSDFYIGVFEMTQQQMRYAASQSVRSLTMWPAVPQQWAKLTYSSVRGGNWPTDGKGQVDADSSLKKIQDLTGVVFDLPTSAEWEYACRAGTSGDYNVSGSINDACWCIGSLAAKGLSGTQPTGLLKPNNWGLYDMHGNVAELCLDLYADMASTYTDIGNPEEDPKGPTSGSGRVSRGSSYANHDFSSKQYLCEAVDEAVEKTYVGFRLWAPAEAR